MLVLFFLLDINAIKNNDCIDRLYGIMDSSQIEILQNKKAINELSNNIELISNLIDKQSDLIGQEQSAIENSLNATTLRLDVFGIIVAVVGLVLGVYISRKEKTIQRLLEQVKEIERETSKTKSEIVNLNEMINNDIEGIYERLKREETTAYLKRLVYEPNDIANLVKMLVSRELHINDFKYLLLAYKKLKENTVDDGDAVRLQSLYLLLFFQHFCGQSIVHDLVREDLVCSFNVIIEAAFKKDMCNATHSLINCLNKEADLIDRTEILYNYIVSLLRSKFMTYEEPYRIIAAMYKYDSELKLLWYRLVENNYFPIILGNLLCDRFINDEVFVNDIKKQIDTQIDKDK